jgi:group I intron endonuclease
MIIYRITNLVNNKLYIGKTERFLKERWKEHLISSQNPNNINHLYLSMRLYGVDKFIIEIIDTANDKNELNVKEKYWIKFYDSQNEKKGYNVLEGGNGGKQPPEIRKLIGKKISKKNKGRIVSKETRDKISKKNKGRIISKEARLTTSNTLKEKFRRGICKPNYHMKGKFKEKHPFYGKHRSEETKRRMSLAKKGKTWEQIYKKEEVREKKREHFSKRMVGENNINNKGYKIEDWNKLITFVHQGKNSKFICNYFQISYYWLCVQFKRTYQCTFDKYRKLKGIHLIKRKRGPLSEGLKKRISNTVKKTLKNKKKEVFI